MNWKFWKRREPENHLVWPSLTMMLDDDGRLQSYCIFPTGLEDSEKASVAKHFALMLSLLNSGKLITSIQKAVAIGGEASDEVIASNVLHYLNSYLAELASERSLDELVVKPSDVFGYPGPAGGQN